MPGLPAPQVVPPVVVLTAPATPPAAGGEGVAGVVQRRPVRVQVVEVDGPGPVVVPCTAPGKLPDWCAGRDGVWWPQANVWTARWVPHLDDAAPPEGSVRAVTWSPQVAAGRWSVLHGQATVGPLMWVLAVDQVGAVVGVWATGLAGAAGVLRDLTGGMDVQLPEAPMWRLSVGQHVASGVF